MLKKIAAVTVARFFMADNADDLHAIYRDVSARLVSETRETEAAAPDSWATAIMPIPTCR